MDKVEVTKEAVGKKQEQKDKKVYSKPSIESQEMFEVADGDK